MTIWLEKVASTFGLMLADNKHRIRPMKSTATAKIANDIPGVVAGQSNLAGILFRPNLNQQKWRKM